MRKWRATAEVVAEREGVHPAVLEIFFHVLEHIADEDWYGACHSSSTILYMLFQEHDIDAEILIGEVVAKPWQFDHSWIEIDGAIYDAAVAFPHPDGEPVGGPIFAGYDLSTDDETANKYGIGTFDTLGGDAQTIARLSIGTYYTFADQRAYVECVGNGYPAPEPLWDRAARIAQAMGLSKTREQLASEHFDIRRTIRTV